MEDVTIFTSKSCRGHGSKSMAKELFDHVRPFSMASIKDAKLQFKVRDVPYPQYMTDLCHVLSGLIKNSPTMHSMSVKVLWKISSDPNEEYKEIVFPK